jgi:hypothetical protein
MTWRKLPGQCSRARRRQPQRTGPEIAWRPWPSGAEERASARAGTPGVPGWLSGDLLVVTCDLLMRVVVFEHVGKLGHAGVHGGVERVVEPDVE